MHIVSNAPKYGVARIADVCDFIDQYVSCAIPTEGASVATTAA